MKHSLIKKIIPFYLMSALLFLHFSVMADVYKWTDESGNVHYGDKPAEHIKAKPIDITINRYGAINYPETSSHTKTTAQPKVVMYSTSWCGYCKKARKHFTSKNIAFTEYDIEKNARAKKEYDALNGRGVPVILVGKQRMNGFTASRFDYLYDL